MATKSFKIVCIPADIEKSVNEWNIEIPASDGSNSTDTLVSCLTDRLKKHFQQTTMTPAQRNNFQTMVSKQLAKQKGGSGVVKNVESAAFARLMTVQTVDIIPLLYNDKSTNWYGINLYVDDQGISKQLPVNTRASQLCNACGTPSNVRGDAFLARIRDDNADLFEREDFLSKEATIEATWVQEALEIKKMRTAQGSAPGGFQIAAQQSSKSKLNILSVLERNELMGKVLKEKEIGKNALKKGNFEAAIQHFLQCSTQLQSVCNSIKNTPGLIDPKVLLGNSNDPGEIPYIAFMRLDCSLQLLLTHAFLGSSQWKRAVETSSNVLSAHALLSKIASTCDKDFLSKDGKELQVTALLLRLRAYFYWAQTEETRCVQIEKELSLSNENENDTTNISASSLNCAISSRLLMNITSLLDNDNAAKAMKDLQKLSKLSQLTQILDISSILSDCKTMQSKVKTLINRGKKWTLKASKLELAKTSYKKKKNESIGEPKKKTKKKSKSKKKKKRR